MLAFYLHFNNLNVSILFILDKAYIDGLREIISASMKSASEILSRALDSECVIGAEIFNQCIQTIDTIDIDGDMEKLRKKVSIICELKQKPVMCL